MRGGRVLRTHAIGFAVLSLLAACGKDAAAPAGPVAAELTLRPSAITLNQFDSTQVIASVLDKDGVLLSGIPVTFESSAPTIATVSNLGVVTSVGPAGAASITVRALSLTATVTVTVSAVPKRLLLSPNPGVLPQLGSLQLLALLFDQAGTAIPDSPVSYVSSDTTILKIAPNGLATSVGPAGQVSVTARSGNFFSTAQVAVTQVPTTIRVSPATARVGRMRSIHLVPEVLDAVESRIDGEMNFTFSSVSPSLLTVSSDGTVTSVGPLGTGIIRIAAVGTDLEVEFPVEVVFAASPVGNLASVLGIGGSSYAVAVTRDDSITSVTYDNLSVVLSARTGAFRPIPGSASAYTVVYDITRNSSFIVTAGGVVREVNHTRGTTTDLLTIPGSPEVFSIALSADARELYVGASDGSINVVDIGARTLRGLVSSGVFALHMTLHPDGRRLYASGNGGLQEVDVTTGQRRTMNTGGGYWQATAITSNGRYLFAISENGILRRFDLTTNASDDVLINCGGWGLGITRDDRFLYAACPDQGAVLVLDAATRATVNRLEGLGDVRRIAMSIDGAIAVVGSSRGVVLIR